MLDWILPYELKPFLLVNGAHTEFLDNFMWLYSGFIVWIPLAFFYLFIISFKKNRRQWIPVLVSILAVFAVSTLLSSGIIKHVFVRPRPTHHPSVMDSVRTLFDYTGSKYGFISGHSTNSFAFAVFTALLFKNRWYSVVVFLWAFVMVYSRMYLGVHFLSDIIGGIITGSFLGFLIYKSYMLYCNRTKRAVARYDSCRSTVLALVIPCYIGLFAWFSERIVSLIY